MLQHANLLVPQTARKTSRARARKFLILQLCNNKAQITLAFRANSKYYIRCTRNRNASNARVTANKFLLLQTTVQQQGTNNLKYTCAQTQANTEPQESHRTIAECPLLQHHRLPPAVQQNTNYYFTRTPLRSWNLSKTHQETKR